MRLAGACVALVVVAAPEAPYVEGRATMDDAIAKTVAALAAQ